jgi:hypothetical protein
VERINQFEFFELGRRLQGIRRFSGDVNAGDAFIPVWEAFRDVSALANGKPMELGVSKACIETLKVRLDEILDKHFRQVDEDGDTEWKFPTADTPPIPSYRWTYMLTALDEFEMVFREEMREASTYRVPDRGIFNTAKLVDAADMAFPADLLPHIPQKTRDDWKAAGRCLAFNLLSASGFHVARAVEGTLEAYYQLATGKDKTLNGWNDYIKALVATAASPAQPLVPSDKVIAALTQMKGDYRNPIVHPRVVLNDADSRMLFANGESVIIAMAQEIRAAKPNPIGLLANIFKVGAAE